MRDIKFRAWDKRNSMMFIDVQTGIDFEDGSHYKFSEFLEDTDRWQVMQYTGLKDKNGVEIYEGDIVKINKDVAEVKWVYEGELSPKLEPFSNIYLSNFEVIGNIHENPELLESHPNTKENI